MGRFSDIVMDLIRKYILILLVFGLASCKSTTETKTVTVNHDEGPAQIEFAELEHDFGVVSEGEKVGWYFSYENIGSSDLVIKDVHTTCGCTVPQFSRKPLPPGEKENLKVIFDSSGKMGKEIKSISIESNAQNTIVKLKLYIEVIN